MVVKYEYYCLRCQTSFQSKSDSPGRCRNCRSPCWDTPPGRRFPGPLAVCEYVCRLCGETYVGTDKPPAKCPACLRFGWLGSAFERKG